MAKIILGSTRETMVGLDGEALVGLDGAEARKLARELTQTWASTLKGDRLEIVEELPHWRYLPMCELRHGAYRDLTASDVARRIEALREYRETGCIEDVFLCSASDLEDMVDDEAAEAGPAVSEIDWTGFPEEYNGQAVGARVSLDNGITYVPVSDLTDEQVERALAGGLINDEAAELAHGASEDEREYLAHYAAAHLSLYGDYPIVG